MPGRGSETTEGVPTSASGVVPTITALGDVMVVPAIQLRSFRLAPDREQTACTACLHRDGHHPPSRRASVTRPHREHHAAGARSSEGWTSDPHPLHRQITGDCLLLSDTNIPFVCRRVILPLAVSCRMHFIGGQDPTLTHAGTTEDWAGSQTARSWVNTTREGSNRARVSIHAG
jgi:hypothetical protein